MATRLNTKKHKHRMISTNRILPLGSLRRKVIRRLFSGWVLKLVHKGRILTAKLAVEICKQLRAQFGMQKASEELVDEHKRMHLLLKCARKRQVGSKRVSAARKQKTVDAMSTVDTLQTVPMQFEDWWALVG